MNVTYMKGSEGKHRNGIRGPVPTGVGNTDGLNDYLSADGSPIEHFKRAISKGIAPSDGEILVTV